MAGGRGWMEAGVWGSREVGVGDRGRQGVGGRRGLYRVNILQWASILH